MARLDFLTRYFDAYLAKAETTSLARAYSKGDLAGFYNNVEDQLRDLQQRYAEAERHLTPIIDAAVKKGR